MDDDEFGGDDLDLIPDNTLQEIEQHALTSTQRPKSTGALLAQRPKIQTYGVTGLTRSNNTGKWRPPQPKHTLRTVPQDAPPASAPEPPSSDYGFDEEDVIDLDEPSMVIQSTSAIPTRGRATPPSRPAPRNLKPAALDPETEAAFAAADAELGAHNPGQWTAAPHLRPQAPTKQDDSSDIAAFQSRIADLEASLARLQNAEQEARNAAQAKAGEIAIVRANSEKNSKEYERRIAVMQKLHADEASKAREELERGRKEREKMETDNRFLAHDLAQEADRAKRLNGPGKARAAVNGNAVGGKENESTPKKLKSGRAILGDGFDDDEVGRTASPSRSKEKSREATPRGNKRKRVAPDSPMPALSFNQPASFVQEESVESRTEEAGGEKRDDERYEFMQRMLNHRPSEGAERSIETLTKYAFPSNDTRTLSAILFDRLATHTAASEESMSLKLSQILLRLWNQCISEQYYQPIYLILDLIRTSLRHELAATISQLIPAGAVNVCMRTIALVAEPVMAACLQPAYAASEEFKTLRDELEQHIDVDEILDFLQAICNASLASSSLSGDESGGKIEEFWQSMEFRFTLLTLNKAHPISQTTAALRILQTSVLPATFGPIIRHIQDVESGASLQQEQAKQEVAIIDRLTTMFFETPEAPPGEEPYSTEEIAELKLEILEVLKCMCMTDHGGVTIVRHYSAIGRLVRFLEPQLASLYRVRPDIGLPDEEQDSIHALLNKSINTTTRLLYHLFNVCNDANVDFFQRVHRVKGGYHKFLVSLSRIAYSEQLVLEAGIENEVVEAAHRILDAVLSPEEGEMVVKAVETPRGTKGSGQRSWEETEINTQEDDEMHMERERGGDEERG